MVSLNQGARGCYGRRRGQEAESEDLILINTARGKVDIEAYPAVRDWLAPFRKELEKRATKQAWWELQQAQLAYQPKLTAPKIVWPHFQHVHSRWIRAVRS